VKDCDGENMIEWKLEREGEEGGHELDWHELDNITPNRR